MRNDQAAPQFRAKGIVQTRHLLQPSSPPCPRALRCALYDLLASNPLQVLLLFLFSSGTAIAFPQSHLFAFFWLIRNQLFVRTRPLHKPHRPSINQFRLLHLTLGIFSLSVCRYWHAPWSRCTEMLASSMNCHGLRHGMRDSSLGLTADQDLHPFKYLIEEDCLRQTLQPLWAAKTSALHSVSRYQQDQIPKSDHSANPSAPPRPRRHSVDSKPTTT